MNNRLCVFTVVLAVLTLQTLCSSAIATPEVLVLRPAQYEIRIEKSVMLTMRDGTRLSTDLYFPVSTETGVPAILMRTPYGKSSEQERSVSAARMFASRGFAVAVQDTRGRFESEGQFGVMYRDSEDGYDTVDWLARQPWSNGKIGTYGCSYRGAVQILQARLKHPALAAMIPQGSTGGGLGDGGGKPRYLGLRRGGALELANTFHFMWYNGSKIHYQPPTDTPRATRIRIAPYFSPTPRLPKIDMEKELYGLPLISLLDRLGAPPTDWRDVVSHKYRDPWWNQFGFFSDEDSADVPTLSVNSWFDHNIDNTLYRVNLFRKNAKSKLARENQFVIISPTGHCESEEATENTVIGDMNMGDARLGHDEIYLRWFDHWLKGLDNGITNMPRVQYYLMGKNEWRSAAKWPLPGTRYTQYNLHSNGHANSRFGDGTLTLSVPQADLITDRFVFDPATPVPSKVGAKGSLHGGPTAGPIDNRLVEMRHDVLVYSSEPLTKGMEVTGPLEAILFVSSSAKDTDFTAKLLVVYPDGRALNLREGIMRARYREGYDREVWMQPRQIYQIRIELDPVSYYFAPGSRIRLEISSSNFPRFDRNLNTGGKNFEETEWVIANNQVHHGKIYPSHILLPIIPE